MHFVKYCFNEIIFALATLCNIIILFLNKNIKLALKYD